MPTLPASTGSRTLDDIAEVIGMEPALRLSARWRGLRIFVRTAYDSADEMVSVIGQDAADRLAAFYGGTSLVIPGEAGIKHQVLALSALGTLTRFEIADTLRIPERRVYRIIAADAAARAAERQGVLALSADS